MRSFLKGWCCFATFPSVFFPLLPLLTCSMQLMIKKNWDREHKMISRQHFVQYWTVLHGVACSRFWSLDLKLLIYLILCYSKAHNDLKCVLIANNREIRVFLCSIQTLAEQLTDEELKEGRLYPPLSNIREVSIQMAVKVSDIFSSLTKVKAQQCINNLLMLVQSFPVIYGCSHLLSLSSMAVFLSFFYLSITQTFSLLL